MAKEKLTEAGGIWLYGKLGTESEWICAERKNLIYKTPAASYCICILNLNPFILYKVKRIGGSESAAEGDGDGESNFWSAIPRAVLRCGVLCGVWWILSNQNPHLQIRQVHRSSSLQLIPTGTYYLLDLLFLPFAHSYMESFFFFTFKLQLSLL